MATCKECLHYDVCERYGRTVDFPVDDGVCLDFADRSKYVVREKGEWLYHTNASVKCPVCGGVFGMAVDFCPYCGSDMRKGESG